MTAPSPPPSTSKPDLKEPITALREKFQHKGKKDEQGGTTMVLEGSPCTPPRANKVNPTDEPDYTPDEKASWFCKSAIF